jgi:hypothetical protein
LDIAGVQVGLLADLQCLKDTIPYPVAAFVELGGIFLQTLEDPSESGVFCSE